MELETIILIFCVVNWIMLIYIALRILLKLDDIEWKLIELKIDNGKK